MNPIGNFSFDLKSKSKIHKSETSEIFDKSQKVAIKKEVKEDVDIYERFTTNK